MIHTLRYSLKCGKKVKSCLRHIFYSGRTCGKINYVSNIATTIAKVVRDMLNRYLWSKHRKITEEHTEDVYKYNS